MRRKILHGDEMWWPLLPLRETHKAGDQCILTCSSSLDIDILFLMFALSRLIIYIDLNSRL